MTTSLVRPRLYTVAEYLELGETESGVISEREQQAVDNALRAAQDL